MYRFLFFFFLLSFGCSKKPNNSTTQPRLENIQESVYASLKIVPNQSYSVRPIFSGIIDQIFVNEGDTVTKDQPLFKISISPTAKLKQSDAQLALEEASSNLQGENNLLSNLQKEIEILQLQYSRDSINYSRLKTLWNQNIGKKVDLENAELAYQNSANRLDLLNKQFSQSQTNLNRQLQRARHLVNSENAQLKDFVIVSKINGTIFNIEKQIGDLISPQEIFAEIGTSNDWIIEMEIDESDIGKITVGDTVVLNLDAYPNQVYSALISFISQRKNELTQTFLVRAAFLISPPQLYYGLNGEANIIVNTKQNAMIIPSSYLLPENKVLTSSGEKEIIIGMKNLDFVEIISGIDTSTVLLKPIE
jgi:HlyD family secretion protein